VAVIEIDPYSVKLSEFSAASKVYFGGPADEGWLLPKPMMDDLCLSVDTIFGRPSIKNY
jgi:hypothetical protein